MVSGTPYRRSCFGQAFLTVISRLLSCREVAPFIVHIFKQSYINLDCEHFPRNVNCVVISYLQRLDIMNNAYDLIFSLRIYETCQRISFRSQLTQLPSNSTKSLLHASTKQRKKRFYDVNALMYIVSDILSLSISDIDFRNKKCNEHGEQLKRSFFLAEGYFYCTIST